MFLVGGGKVFCFCFSRRKRRQARNMAYFEERCRRCVACSDSVDCYTEPSHTQIFMLFVITLVDSRSRMMAESFTYRPFPMYQLLVFTLLVDSLAQQSDGGVLLFIALDHSRENQRGGEKMTIKKGDDHSNGHMGDRVMI